MIEDIHSTQFYIDYAKEKFDIRELVPPNVYKAHGESAWYLFDKTAIAGLGWIRHKFKAMVCNDWHNDGDREWSGLRTPESDYYRAGSMHSMSDDRLCGAFDLLPQRISVDEIRQKLALVDSPYIRRIENKVGWLHIDIKEPPKWHKDRSKVYFFNPG